MAFPSSPSIPYVVILLGCLLVTACGREGEEIVVPDNYAKPYEGIPTLKVENYLNRLYIDLLGREPLDHEMERDVVFLRAGNLAKAQRQEMVNILMEDQTFIEGDSSYQIAYYHRLYELSKARLLEGVSDEEIADQWGIFRSDFISDSLAGNQIGMLESQAKMDRLSALLETEQAYRLVEIDLVEVYRRMLDNHFYDEINMNTVNFIRACFDNLFFRQPTQSEFDLAFPIIEYNTASTLFGQSASNKAEFLQILLDSREYHEGMIRWVYVSLLAREPTSTEVKEQMDIFFTSKDLQALQLQILISDEYANF